ncbi:hypothetical protein [Halovivax sp.]|uniref:hypothetical protein n=1 Tax=Halovivax sp. TaxID=1935978 RepID=UPI0025C26ACB|nr:hypothetical protein [Halovivax sp.]
MTDCEYCAESFPREDAYLDHLAEVHRDELGRIDRKRVERHRGSLSDDDGDGPNKIVLYGLGVMFVLLIIGTIAAVLAMGGEDGGDERVHEHGYITLDVDGEYYDFDRPEYYYEEGNAGTFHFHGGEQHRHDPDRGEYYWHMHWDRVTLAEAMDDVDKPITATSIEVDGEVYDDEDPDTDVEIVVNGDPASPDTELHDGDHIEITVETDE